MAPSLRKWFYEIVQSLNKYRLLECFTPIRRCPGSGFLLPPVGPISRRHRVADKTSTLRIVSCALNWLWAYWHIHILKFHHFKTAVTQQYCCVTVSYCSLGISEFWLESIAQNQLKAQLTVKRIGDLYSTRWGPWCMPISWVKERNVSFLAWLSRARDHTFPSGMQKSRDDGRYGA